MIFNPCRVGSFQRFLRPPVSLGVSNSKLLRSLKNRIALLLQQLTEGLNSCLARCLTGFGGKPNNTIILRSFEESEVFCRSSNADNPKG